MASSVSDQTVHVSVALHSQGVGSVSIADAGGDGAQTHPAKLWLSDLIEVLLSDLRTGRFPDRHLRLIDKSSPKAT